MIRFAALALVVAACSHPAAPPARPLAPPVTTAPPAAPEHPIADPATVADADKPMIKRHIQRHLNELQYCYEKELLAKPGLGGVIHATFTIEKSGAVSSSTATGIAEVAPCIADVIKQIAFDPPASDRAVVEYPFVFHTTDEGVAAPTIAAGGDPDKVMIRRHVRRAIDKIQYCYEKQLLAQPGLHGTTKATFTIEADGTVSRSVAGGFQTDVDTCVAAVIKGIAFDRPSAGHTEVNYPFVFRGDDAGKPGAPTVSVGTAPQPADNKLMIRSHIRAEIARIQYCYEKVLLQKPTLTGTVTVTFFIAPTGSVASSSGSGMDPDVATCVSDVIKTILFDQPAGGGGIQVNYPFVFHPS